MNTQDLSFIGLGIVLAVIAVIFLVSEKLNKANN